MGQSHDRAQFFVRGSRVGSVMGASQLNNLRRVVQLPEQGLQDLDTIIKDKI
jgi:hypothetical protein